MRRFGKVLARLVGLVVFVMAALWLIGPYEPVKIDVSFDESKLAQGVDVYLTKVEAAAKPITKGVEKRVIWAAEPGQKTPLSIVYLHGFSATSEEIRPVPDDVAAALGANLYFARLTGHGQDAENLAKARVADWMYDTAEAMAIARAIGEQVIVISTSTGGTLAALAAIDPRMSQNIVAQVLIAPNFRLGPKSSIVLTLPGARYWLPLIAGAERSFTPRNEDQATYWTTRYPTTALLPMAALVKYARAQDYRETPMPALFIYSENDRVLRHEDTARIAEQWGGGADIINPIPGPEDDPYEHVIAGAIMSPGISDSIARDILEWLNYRN